MVTFPIAELSWRVFEFLPEDFHAFTLGETCRKAYVAVDLREKLRLSSPPLYLGPSAALHIWDVSDSERIEDFVYLEWMIRPTLISILLRSQRKTWEVFHKIACDHPIYHRRLQMALGMALGKVFAFSSIQPEQVQAVAHDVLNCRRKQLAGWRSKQLKRRDAEDRRRAVEDRRRAAEDRRWQIHAKRIERASLRMERVCCDEASHVMQVSLHDSSSLSESLQGADSVGDKAPQQSDAQPQSESREWSDGEPKLEVVHEINADLTQVLQQSKMEHQELPLNADGLSVFRLTSRAGSEDVDAALLESDAVKHCRDRLTESGCAFKPHFTSGARCLVPVTVEVIEELALLGFELGEKHILALRADKCCIEAALRTIPYGLRPRLSDQHRALVAAYSHVAEANDDSDQDAYLTDESLQLRTGSDVGFPEYLNADEA